LRFGPRHAHTLTAGAQVRHASTQESMTEAGHTTTGRLAAHHQLALGQPENGGDGLAGAGLVGDERPGVGPRGRDHPGAADLPRVRGQAARHEGLVEGREVGAGLGLELDPRAQVRAGHEPVAEGGLQLHDRGPGGGHRERAGRVRGREERRQGLEVTRLLGDRVDVDPAGDEHDATRRRR
jgi:hypothetical protein